MHEKAALPAYVGRPPPPRPPPPPYTSPPPPRRRGARAAAATLRSAAATASSRSGSMSPASRRKRSCKTRACCARASARSTKRAAFGTGAPLARASAIVRAISPSSSSSTSASSSTPCASSNCACAKARWASRSLPPARKRWRTRMRTWRSMSRTSRSSRSRASSRIIPAPGACLRACPPWRPAATAAASCSGDAPVIPSPSMIRIASCCPACPSNADKSIPLSHAMGIGPVSDIDGSAAVAAACTEALGS
mmetsp:Transcript_14257/g.39340  ORF Transcript_14257/g.39340 Transcript_14257/m.39340 type:complete len:251 (-) Transcript_14257:630-1382(-)